MSLRARIGKVITGLLIIAGAVAVMMIPDVGYYVIALILGITLLVSGIGSLIYFFTMARHMVGGRDTLYSGLIKIDFALFTLSVADVPKIFVMLYLVAFFGVTGLLRLLRGVEAQRKKAPNWLGSFLSGAINLLVAFLCLSFIGNTAVMVVIYGIGLICTGIRRIADAFHRATIVYIP